MGEIFLKAGLEIFGGYEPTEGISLPDVEAHWSTANHGAYCSATPCSGYKGFICDNRLPRTKKTQSTRRITKKGQSGIEDGIRGMLTDWATECNEN